jgi:hypothetical protein
MKEYSVAVTIDVTIAYAPGSEPESAADLRMDAEELVYGATLNPMVGVDASWVAEVDQVRVYRGQFGKGQR